MRVGAMTEPRGGTLGTLEQQSDAAFTMLRHIAVLWRQNIHHRDRSAGKILDWRRQCAAAQEQFMCSCAVHAAMQLVQTVVVAAFGAKAHAALQRAICRF